MLLCCCVVFTGFLWLVLIEGQCYRDVHPSEALRADFQRPTDTRQHGHDCIHVGRHCEPSMFSRPVSGIQFN